MKIAMTKTLMLVCGLMLTTSSVAQNKITAVFDWAHPESLTPAFTAPTMDNRSVMIDAAEFSNSGVSVFVDDSQVSELSRKARLYYGYTTAAVELRFYANSDLVITAPEGMVVESVSFTGPEADGYYLSSYDESSKWSGATWIAGTLAQEVKFYCATRCEISTTTVICKESSGVGDIVVDESDAQELWYDLGGRCLIDRPTSPGIYLLRQGSKTTKHVVR